MLLRVFGAACSSARALNSLCDEQTSLSEEGITSISFAALFPLIGKWLQPFRWSLCNVSICPDRALQWYMEQRVLLWRCGGRPAGGTPALSPPPSISSVSQLSLPIFCLPFVLWLYHSSLFLSLVLVLMLSLITASPLCSLSLSLSLTCTPLSPQALPPLAPIFDFWWTPIFSSLLPRFLPSLICSFLLSSPTFVPDFQSILTPRPPSHPREIKCTHISDKMWVVWPSSCCSYLSFTAFSFPYCRRLQLDWTSMWGHYQVAVRRATENNNNGTLMTVGIFFPPISQPARASLTSAHQSSRWFLLIPRV